MTKERFDQFKNIILKLSQEADAFGEQFSELKTTKDMVIRLARKQKRQMDLTEQELQKAMGEIKIIQFELKKALEKIKELEKDKIELEKNKMESMQSMQSLESDSEEDSFPVDDTLDLEMLAHDIDTKLAQKEEEETYNYMKKMDMDL